MIAVERSDLDRCRALVSGAPSIDPIALIAAFDGSPIAALESRSGAFAVGIGEAFVVEAHGPERFGSIRRQAADVFASVGHRGRPLRMFGGFAFEETDARFVLPRWLYETSAEGGKLTLTLRGDEDPEQIDRERRRLLAAFESAPAIGRVPRVFRVDRLGDYAGMVSKALERIGAGALEKVVLARRIRVEAEERYAIAPVLAALENGGAVRFAFGKNGAFFAGATPELLVARSGAEVLSAALAGSARPESAAALFESKKDRAEHGHVERFVKSTLETLAGDVRVGEHRLSRQMHVAHLSTPITARLFWPMHVLELAEALHPTPAVGGSPRREACDFIRAIEREERGWYAGPVGWFDAEGDGEFNVALRSARFGGSSADLFVGAGIVTGSDPEAEDRETELKARTMLSALGA